MYDVVFPLSPGPSDYDELRYSLRSLEINTQAERVHFFGGKPTWLRSGLYVRTKQPYDKLRNIRFQWRAIIDNPDVSDPFWYLNDDVFVMEPLGLRRPVLWHGGDFVAWLRALGPRYLKSPYAKGAQATIKALREHHPALTEIKCWSLHTPLLVYKSDMDDALKIDAGYGQRLHLRTLYGNLAGLIGEQAPVHDVKGYAAAPPGQIYASTANSTWKNGALGKQIRARFPEKSRWER